MTAAHINENAYTISYSFCIGLDSFAFRLHIGSSFNNAYTHVSLAFDKILLHHFVV